MKFIKDDYVIVALIEQCDGNETVGSQWIESKIFSPNQNIQEIIEWAEKRHCAGKLIITVTEKESAG